eukprot:scaffold12042_cov118-Skeletonema_marinoi.AAC.3
MNCLCREPVFAPSGSLKELLNRKVSPPAEKDATMMTMMRYRPIRPPPPLWRRRGCCSPQLIIASCLTSPAFLQQCRT